MGWWVVVGVELRAHAPSANHAKQVIHVDNAVAIYVALAGTRFGDSQHGQSIGVVDSGQNDIEDGVIRNLALVPGIVAPGNDGSICTETHAM